ncbi:hypothetical protein FUT69_02515 [Xylella taiwanensis]|nr:hypothetical protein [Xylella taiwanensis]MCD8457115.1 hypothetical protein [Xylella taiwanensis]MCD8461609.1 hypothetical protein [Xylella taiwanensis]MCD8462364.1 hypothetical protein [Xylella taiwanensis]MCD8468530.1 hypothetical protein [Xylella taiwanensis]MCD8469132.1 hypothetical protein [Xylella taiwanensis]
MSVTLMESKDTQPLNLDNGHLIDTRGSDTRTSLAGDLAMKPHLLIPRVQRRPIVQPHRSIALMSDHVKRSPSIFFYLHEMQRILLRVFDGERCIMEEYLEDQIQ